MFRRAAIIAAFLALSASAQSLADTLVIANFDNGSDPMNIDATSFLSQTTWSGGVNRFVYVSTVTHNNSPYALEINHTNPGGSGWGSYTVFNFTNNLTIVKDVSQYKALSFWVKGVKGDGSEDFMVALRVCTNGVDVNTTNARPQISGFTVRGVSTDWQKVVIPISALMQGLPADRLHNVVGFELDFASNLQQTQTVYVDDFIFHTQCDPVYVDNFEDANTYDAYNRALELYSDVYSAGNYFANVSSHVFMGSRAFEMNTVTTNSSLVAFNFKFCDTADSASMPLDVSMCNRIEMALQRGLTSGASIQAKLEVWDNNGEPALESYSFDITNQMVQYTIPFASFNGGFTSISSTCTQKLSITWAASGQASTAAIYVDQIRFVNNSTPTVLSGWTSNGSAVGSSFVFTSTNAFQVTSDSCGPTGLMENVRFEHDNMSGGAQWYTIFKATNTSGTLYNATWYTLALQNGTTYQVRAVSENINGNTKVLGPYTNCTVNNDFSAPAAISDLTALAGSTDGTVTLQWTAPGDNEASNNIVSGMYKLVVSTGLITAGVFDSVPNSPQSNYAVQFATAVTAGSAQKLTLTGLYPGTTYFFALKTRDTMGNWSVWPGTAASVNSASFTPAPDYAPNATGALYAVASDSAVALSWNNPSAPNSYVNDYARYWVYMATSSFDDSMKLLPWVSVAATAPYTGTNPVNTQVSGLSNYTTYFFHVSLWDSTGSATSGLYSLALESFSAVEISTMPTPGVPFTPTGFQGAAASTTAINWSWSDVSNETSYSVYVGTEPGTLVSPVLSANVVAWQETGLSPNAQYIRAVLASNPSGPSPLSQSATVYTLANPPAGLSVSNVTPSSVTVSWGLNNNPNGTRFGVGYSTDSNYLVSVTTPINYASAFTGVTTAFFGLSSGATYYFHVWAYNGDQFASSHVAVSTRTVQVNAPAGFGGVAQSTYSISWSWSGVANNDGYRVKYATSSSVSVSPNIPSGTNNWLEAGLSANVQYGRGVVSYAGAYESLISNTSYMYTLANPPLSPVVTAAAMNSVTLSWAANNNPGTTRYGVAYSSTGYFVNVTTSINYASNNTAVSATIGSLQNNVTYYFDIWAYNGDQFQTAAVTVSTMTPLISDTTAPAFASVTTVSSVYLLDTDISITANVTDNVQVSGAALFYSVSGGSTKAVSMSYVSGGDTNKVFTGVIPGSEVKAGVTIGYYVAAIDWVGNTAYWNSVSSPQVITVKASYTSSAVSSGTITLPNANPDEGVVSVTIPGGALKDGTAVTIQQIDPATVTSAPAGAESALPAGVFEFTTSPAGQIFRKPVTITLLFKDLSPKDGIEDNLKVAVSDLRVFWWDGVEWRLVGGTVNDYTSSDPAKVNTVSFQTNHFSRYAIFAVKDAQALYKPKERIITPVLKDGYNDQAQFDGLAGMDVEIKIFNVQGKRIRTINVLAEGNVWNGKDDNSEYVESGAYIFQFKLDGKLYSGTIVVAR